MSSPCKNPEDVAASVLKRAEVSKMARKLQNRLALAQFKAKNGWQDLTLVEIEPKLDERLRLKRPSSSGDMLSDTSSSSAYSDFAYPRALASSPMKGPIFSDALQSSSGSSGHRKRTYNHTLNGNAFPTSHNSARKRFRQSPIRNADFFNPHTAWRDEHQLAQSSPIKPRKQHFTTAAGPDLSFYHTSNDSIPEENFMSASSEEEDLLPLHSFQMPEMQRERHVSPPRTPPPLRSRPMNRRSHTTHGRVQHNQQSQHGQEQGQEGADLLLYLATSPSPAQPTRNRFTGGNTFLPQHSHSKSFTDSFISTETIKSNFKAAHAASQSVNSASHHSNASISSVSQNNNIEHTPMQPPSTPPPKKDMALPSSMMTTPGGGFGVPTTPGQGWDFAEFVNITPSPAQKAWRTPRVGETPKIGQWGTPRLGEIDRTPRVGEARVGNENVRPQRTPRTRANGKFEGFMQPPMSSPMLGSRAASSRIGGELGEELETLR